MANALCFSAPVNSSIWSPSRSSSRPCGVTHHSALTYISLNPRPRPHHSLNPSSGFDQDGKSHAPLVAKASGSNPATKPNSIVCADCDGNGAVLCSQCKGTGVNSVDHFNGQFKAGQLCWLCRGKRDILCGNCNGAGFVGGFMSTFDS